jgi:hypothetical protein
MPELLQQEQFARHLGEVFRLDAGDGASPLDLRLAEVTSLAKDRSAPDAPRSPFALLFRGPLSPWARQGTYPLDHAELGRLEIFLVPIGPDAEGMRYEAIFT